VKILYGDNKDLHVQIKTIKSSSYSW